LTRPFDIAVQFLTVFRVRVEPPADMAEVGRSAWAFPLVGALIGLILVTANFFFQGYLPDSLLAVLVVGIWIALTGGLHLDGWADCWDALVTPVPPERRREIMKDSRLGTFGALGLFLLLALKIAAVASGALPLYFLFLAPVVGRGMIVIGARGAPHTGQGMGAAFFSGMDTASIRWVAILTFVPALLAGWIGILAAVGALIAGLCFRRLAEKRLEFVNGDVLGAICELCETSVLILGCARWF
jgi:adenosylcobinamide-GDP ribazoletransferase